MNRDFKKFIAVLCAIVLVVTSMTIYKNTAKAADYEGLDFIPVQETMDSSYEYCITENTLTGFARLNFYGVNYMQIFGDGNSKMLTATITIDGVTVTDRTIAFDRADAITGFMISKLEDNQYHEIALSGEGGNITIVLKKGTPTSGGESESSSENQGESESSSEAPSVATPEMVSNPLIQLNKFNDVDGQVIYVAGLNEIKNAKTYNLYVDGKLWGTVTNGANIKIVEFEAGTHLFQVTGVNDAGESALSTGWTITIPDTEEETTESEQPSESTPDVVLPEMVTNPLIQLNKFNEVDGQVIYVAGLNEIKNAKTYNLYVDGKLWGTVTNGANIKIAEFEAGTHLFQVTGVNENGESALSTGYTITIPEDVQKYKVKIDGTEVEEVEEGQTYTLPTDATYGYFDGTKMYKFGATVTVTSDMTFTSVNEADLALATFDGASIRFAQGEGDETAIGGIRFKTTVTASETLLASEALTTGTLITVNDYITESGSLTLESTYAKLDIRNEGWFDADGDGEGDVGTYCGSIVNINESNWIREYAARGYVTITYADGTQTTVYSDVVPVRSIKAVAQKLLDKNYTYDDAIMEQIRAYAAAM